MRNKTTSRILAVLLSASLTIPAAGSFALTAAAVAASSWTVNAGDTAGSITQSASKAFDDAMKTYSGAKLTPVTCYASQVVAGYNYYFICTETSSDGNSSLKETVIYSDPSGTSTVSSVSDFSIDDYAKNYDLELPPYPASGNTAPISGNTRCELPQEAERVFNKCYEGLAGYSCTPWGYLGKKTDSTGTDYAFICQTYTVVANPDYYVSVVILHEDADGNAYCKSTYDLLGESSGYDTNSKISYEFSSWKPGYAQGKLYLHADKDATYKLYWADDQKALDGYYPIGELKLKAGSSGSIDLGYHTVIPANARYIIATTGSLNISDAYSVYKIPNAKRLDSASGDFLYSFSAYSDIHIDKGSGWYVNAESNFKQALKYSNSKGADYIVVSGDCVTNDSGPDKEWDAYTKILSKSEYVNPVWESDGNHDLRQDVSSGLKSFIKGSGTDGSKSGKSYFYKIEKNTGDMFIFMSLELSKSPQKEEVFSDEQIAWVNDLIENNYSSRNIFLVQHAPIKGFGAGDRMTKPYYGGLMKQDLKSTKKFKEILEKYPNIVFLSGHTHEDYVMDYNYSNENETAANMIHTPSLAGSTMPNSSDTGLERNGGKGFNSQGYFVEVYENEIVFYGANITEGKIYPKYSYIMEGSRTSDCPVINAVPEEYPEPVGQTVDLTQELSRVSSILSSNYKYASYDSYQALKKYYYHYKTASVCDPRVIDIFEQKIKDLEKYIGTVSTPTLYDTYYFTNNKKWSSVYAYAWNGSNKNAEWPGVKLSKVGTNSYNEDIYRVSLGGTDKYNKIIFNSGSNSNQTVDIMLDNYSSNGFYIKGSENGKYTVGNYSYDPQGRDQLTLLYYIKDEHGWSDMDASFTCGSDGVYSIKYDADSSKTFSFCIYNKTTNEYYCVPDSVRYDFETGKTSTYSMDKMSSRGKSVTIDGMSNNTGLEISFDKSTKKVTVKCSGTPEVPELINRSYIETESAMLGESFIVRFDAEGGTGDYRYSVSYKESADADWIYPASELVDDNITFKLDKAGEYPVKLAVRDNSGTVAVKETVVTVVASEELKNLSTVSSKNIALGDTVTLTAAAEGGTAPYRYALMYKKATSSTWTKIGTKYGTASTGSFKPGKAVVYDVMINVKDSTDKVKSKSFKINVSAPLKNTSTISATTVKAGQTVTLSGSATGGTAPYKYALMYKKASSNTWTKIGTKYGTASTGSFKPGKAVPYVIMINVKDSSGTIKSKTFNLTVE